MGDSATGERVCLGGVLQEIWSCFVASSSSGVVSLGSVSNEVCEESESRLWLLEEVREDRWDTVLRDFLDLICTVLGESLGRVN